MSPGWRNMAEGRIVEDGVAARLDMLSDILTSREAHEFLKIGRTKLWDLTRKNSIPAYRLGEGKTSGLRYKRSELLAWLDEHKI